MPDKKTVKKVAEIARLNLSEEELDKLSKDLDSILKAFKFMQNVDTKKVKPTFQPIEVKNVLREDKVKPGLSQKKALSNTKLKEKGFFKGPKAV